MMTVPIFGEPVISSVNVLWHVDCTNYIWRISNVHFKTSMAWLMVQSYLVSALHFNDVLCVSWFVVSAMLFCYQYFFKKNYHTRLPYSYLASVGFTQACPN